MSYFDIQSTMYPSVFRLEDPRGVFMTLIVGRERAFLADTGMGIGDAAAAVREITGLPLTAVNTHGHIDHIGGNYQFESVLLSALDSAAVKRAVAEHVKRRIIDMPGCKVPESFDEAAFLGYQGDNLVALEPNACFDLGGTTVTAIPHPSHTPGSMLFLCPELRLLLSGDCVSPIVYLVFEESCTVARHIELLRRVEELPFDHIFSSHNKDIIRKRDIGLYIRCAESVVPEQTVRFRNPLFPDAPGRMFIYRNPECRYEYAAVVYGPGKLGGGV